MTDSNLLRRAAFLASERDFFLAAPLLAYARAEGLDDAALAQRLGCPLSDLPALLLCRRPVGDTFDADVQRLVERFHVEADRLIEILRSA